MLISSVNISQGWTLSECAIIPHRGGDEIAWEARLVWGRAREIGSRWEETGPKKPIIYVLDNPGSSLTGDTAILKATRGTRGVIMVRQAGQQEPSPQTSQGRPVSALVKGGEQSMN